MFQATKKTAKDASPLCALICELGDYVLVHQKKAWKLFSESIDFKLDFSTIKFLPLRYAGRTSFRRLFADAPGQASTSIAKKKWISEEETRNILVTGALCALNFRSVHLFTSNEESLFRYLSFTRRLCTHSQKTPKVQFECTQGEMSKLFGRFAIRS